MQNREYIVHTYIIEIQLTNHLIPLCPRLPDWPDIITFITLNWIYSCKKPGIETVRTYSQASAAYLDIRHTVFAV